MKCPIEHLLIAVALRIISCLAATTATETRNLSDPLLYTRLRFEEGYLQILRNYQLYESYKEKQISSNFSYVDFYNKTKTEVVNYYESTQYERSDLRRNDAIIEVLDRIYLSKIIQYQLYGYDNLDDRKRSADPRLVSAERCNSEIDLLNEKLSHILEADGTQPTDLGALSFFDNYGRVEDGIYLGNILWLGSWKDCYRRHIFSIENQMNHSHSLYSFKGRYCVASIKDPKWEPKIQAKVQKLLNNKEKPFFKYPGQEYDYARFFKIHIGLCLPESCDSSIIDSKNNEIHRLITSRLDYPFKDYNLIDLFCLPDEGSPLRQFDIGAWLFVLFAIGWFGFLFVVTMVDYFLTKAETTSSTKGNSIFLRWTRRFVSTNPETKRFIGIRMAVSLIRNFKKVKTMKSPFRVYNKLKTEIMEREQEKKNFARGKQMTGKSQSIPDEKNVSARLAEAQFLNGFKFITILPIILTHSIMFLFDQSKYPLDYDLMSYRITYHYGTTMPFAVDWFFFITGLLTSYSVFVTKMVYKLTPFQWAYSIVKRYWRLAPTYILLFWFMRSVFTHIASGPLWDYGTHNRTVRSICKRESWFYPLTLTSNLHPLHEECIMPAWYIGNDMQFYLVSPFLLVLLAKSSLLGWIVNSAIVVGCVLARMHSYLTSPRARPLDLMRPNSDLVMRNNWDMHPTYLYPHMRISTYIIGLLAGHYMYMVLDGQWKSFMFVDRGKWQVETKTEGESEKIELCHTGNKANEEQEQSWPSQLENSKHAKAAKLRRKFAWWFGVILVFMTHSASLILRHLPKSLDQYAYFNAAMLYGMDHTMVGLGLAFITTATIFGEYPRFRLFMSHPLFTVLSRLNYIVYIIQIEVIYYLLQSSEYHMERQSSDQIIEMVNVIGLVMLLSFLLVPIVEMPLLNLEKLFSEAMFKPRRRPGARPVPVPQQEEPPTQRGQNEK